MSGKVAPFSQAVLTRRIPVALFLLLTTATGPLGAQNRNSGEIRGTVLDTSGAAVPEVSVVVKNNDTGIVTNVTSGSTGVFDAPSLTPGTYTVTFARSGFEQAVTTGVLLRVETITVNATLHVGSTSEQVTVQAEAPLLQTESSERGLFLTSETISELPNTGRDWGILTRLIPGVNPAKNGQEASGNSVGFNGTQGYQGNYQTDGGTATLPISNNVTSVLFDSVSELNVNTSNFGAEYGNGLYTVNLITKSGTNQFHGSGFEFLQNDALKARNAFSPSVTPLRWDMFGGTVGGPIKRNKAFFFFAYQRNVSNTFAPAYYTYPTAAMRTGDFSAAGYPAIYNPATQQTVNGVTTRAPFAGNIIPANQLDPVALAIQKHFPEPNLPGVYNNYYTYQSSPFHSNYYDFKGDYNISATNRVEVSGTIYNSGQFAPVPSCPVDCQNISDGTKSSQFTDVWTLSPTKVNEFRFSLSRQGQNRTTEDEGQNYPAQLGLKNAAYDAFPTINIGGPQSMSSLSTFGTILAQTAFVTSDSATFVLGNHTLKFGGEFDKWQENQAWAYADAGTFSFSGIFSRNPSDSSSQGLGYADFLLGLPQTWSVNQAPLTGGRVWNFQSFVQDYYKIKPNLTLNFGVRYLYQPGWTEEHNRMSNFDPTAVNPATGALGAVTFAGVTGPKQLEATVPAFFAPRVGFAWSPGSNWSVRGGFGLFNSPFAGDSYYSPSYGGWAVTGYETATNLVNPIFSLAQGPPAAIYPAASGLTGSLLNGQNLNYWPYHTPIAYVEQWQFNIQHQFAHDYVVDAAYVGNKSVHLGFGTDINQVPANLLGPGDAQLNRPYPQYSNINAASWNGYSSYNSLQLSAHKRLSKGLFVQTSYTYAKYLDTGTAGGGSGTMTIEIWQIANDPRANYGRSQDDIRHTWSGAGIFDIPVGNGRRFLNRRGVLDEVIGGWQLSSTAQVHSGLPITPVVGTANLSGALSGTWYPNRMASGTLSNPSASQWFNTSAFVAPSEYTFGNSGRNILDGPGYLGVDLSLAKSFALHFLGEQGSLQFRADSFNALNHTNLGQPNANIGTAGAGVISSALTSRNVQLGAILHF